MKIFQIWLTCIFNLPKLRTINSERGIFMSGLKKTLTSVMALAMLAGCSSSTAATTTTSGSTSNKTVTVAIDADLNTMDYHIATDGNSFIMPPQSL